MTAFIKMHGLGNDFVVIDERVCRVNLTPGLAEALADRRRGIGCDQVISLIPDDDCDCGMIIQNADGSSATACGNASRCVAALLFDETGSDQIRIKVSGRQLECIRDGGDIAINMGPARFGWRDIPIAEARDTDNISIEGVKVAPGVAVNVGNPHIIFFVDDLDDVDVDALGPQVENDPLFVDGVNVSFAQVLESNHIRLIVWERGTGVTGGCGTGALATLAAAVRTGRTGRSVTVSQLGGALRIRWADNDDLWMTGPYALSYRGEVNLASLVGEDD